MFVFDTKPVVVRVGTNDPDLVGVFSTEPHIYSPVLHAVLNAIVILLRHSKCVRRIETRYLFL